MTTIMHLLNRKTGQLPGQGILGRAFAKLASYSELFWGVTAFLLFLLLGPFSVFAALIAVFASVPEADTMQEPDAIVT